VVRSLRERRFATVVPVLDLDSTPRCVAPLAERADHSPKRSNLRQIVTVKKCESTALELRAAVVYNLFTSETGGELFILCPVVNDPIGRVEDRYIR
jgi:hypothetical protein